MGSGQVITGFDKAVTGMIVGDRKGGEIPCDDAYGAHNPEGRHEFPRSSVPEDTPLEIGTRLQMSTPDGRAVMVVVVEVGDETIILDANHPLAGKDLTFDIELVSIG